MLHAQATTVNPNSRQTCSGCGSNTHWILGTPPRHSHCPAWGKTCQICNKPNHQASACRQQSSANSLMAHIQLSNDIPYKCISHQKLMMHALRRSMSSQIVVLTYAWEYESNFIKWVSQSQISVRATNRSKQLVVPLHAKDGFQSNLSLKGIALHNPCTSARKSIVYTSANKCVWL